MEDKSGAKGKKAKKITSTFTNNGLSCRYWLWFNAKTHEKNRWWSNKSGKEEIDLSKLSVLPTRTFYPRYRNEFSISQLNCISHPGELTIGKELATIHRRFSRLQLRAWGVIYPHMCLQWIARRDCHRWRNYDAPPQRKVIIDKFFRFRKFYQLKFNFRYGRIQKAKDNVTQSTSTNVPICVRDINEYDHVDPMPRWMVGNYDQIKKHKPYLFTSITKPRYEQSTMEIHLNGIVTAKCNDRCDNQLKIIKFDCTPCA